MVYGSEPAKGNCKIIINIIQRTQGKKNSEQINLCKDLLIPGK